MSKGRLGVVLAAVAIVTVLAPSAGAAVVPTATHAPGTVGLAAPARAQLTTATHCPPPCWDPWYRCHHPHSCGDDGWAG
jgi:hypothetical protein